jgi:hypothetical protein
MCKLKRLVQGNTVLGRLDVVRISILGCLLEFANPNLDQSLELISPVSKVSDRVHKEGTFSHADSVSPRLNNGLLLVFVVVLTILLDPSLEFFGIVVLSGVQDLHLILQVVIETILDLLDFQSLDSLNLSLPLPLEIPLAVILFFVEGAASADLLIHNGRRLQSI